MNTLPYRAVCGEKRVQRHAGSMRSGYVKFVTLILATAAVASSAAFGDAGSITIDVAHPTHAISSTLYGLMTEEINHSYDGGLYGELIQNRAFKDPISNRRQEPSLVHWSLIEDNGGTGALSLDETDPVTPQLNESMKLEVTNASANSRVGFSNEGFWGIPVRPRTAYEATFWAKSASGFAGPLTVSIETADGSRAFAKGVVNKIGVTWTKFSVKLVTAADAGPTASGRFVIAATSPGTVWFSLVSLFPPTFANQANGFRIDLMEKMAAMHPSFLRLPGGNYLEGNTIADRFPWKTTLGDLTIRPGHRCCWGYRSSDGLGLLEYLKWCEDLKMQPVLAVYAGYSLSGQHVNPGADLEPFVQDALDEIEYVTGDPKTTKWGAQRGADGHRAPFPLTYVEIGNEDFADRSGSYSGRFAQFFQAIKAKYPKLLLIATTRVNGITPDVYDDHYYRSAGEMEADAAHYDSYDRNGPKVFVGEWATTEGNPTPDMNAALGDAAWLTGLERDSDVVTIASYAPLFVNVNPGASQWGTNLIGYDGLTSFGSPSYYAQCMFSQNKGDMVLPVDLQTLPTPAASPVHGAIGVGTWGTQAEFKDISVTNGAQTLYQSDFTAANSTYTPHGGSWSVVDGALSQSGGGDGVRAVMGDPSWTDYTLSLKARKTGGAEGFLILFHVQNQDQYTWWNVGGWNDTQTGVEQISGGVHSVDGAFADTTVDTGTWHDLKVVVSGAHYQCYFDGKLTNEGDERPARKRAEFFEEASRDNASGDVILKFVNTDTSQQTFGIDLTGVKSVSSATLTTISGEPDAVNTVANPTNVAPVTSTLAIVGPDFSQTFPGHSVNVLRIKVSGKG